MSLTLHLKLTASETSTTYGPLLDTLAACPIPSFDITRGRLAQRLEHRSYKPGVIGSSPIPPTIHNQSVPIPVAPN